MSYTVTQPDHDADGNMTYLPSFTGNWNLAWNAENRLVKAVSPGTKLEFTYDYKGRRIQKKVFERDDSSDLWSLTSDLRYIYNGWNLIYTATTTDSSQQSCFAKASEDRQHTVKTYTWGLDLSGQLQGAGGVGGLLAVSDLGSQTSGLWYPTYDANGNVSEYIDTNGNTVAHYEYSPFGRLTTATGDKAADFNHRFSTKYQSNETGLYYYGYRYYSAELGRWLSRDPIGEMGGLNLYATVGNRILNAFDRLGLVDCGKLRRKREQLRTRMRANQRRSQSISDEIETLTSWHSAISLAQLAVSVGSAVKSVFTVANTARNTATAYQASRSTIHVQSALKGSGTVATGEIAKKEGIKAGFRERTKQFGGFIGVEFGKWGARRESRGDALSEKSMGKMYLDAVGSSGSGTLKQMRTLAKRLNQRHTQLSRALENVVQKIRECCE